MGADSNTILTTVRLALREVEADDAYAFRDYMTDEAYWRTLPIDPPTLSSIRAFLAQCARDRVAEPRPSYFLAAHDRVSGMLVGEGVLHVRSRRWRQAEIGWGGSPPTRSPPTPPPPPPPPRTDRHPRALAWRR